MLAKSLASDKAITLLYPTAFVGKTVNVISFSIPANTSYSPLLFASAPFTCTLVISVGATSSGSPALSSKSL